MSVVLGVDGGAAKTVALVAGIDGTILAAGPSGGADVYRAHTPEHAVRAVEEAVTPALYKAGVQLEDVSAATFSLMGVEWPEDFAFWRGVLERRGFGQSLRIVHDVVGTLRGGSPDGTGVVVSCGDGTSVGARSDTGEAWNSGHWQEPQGAQQLAEKALRAVYRAEVGIDPTTALKARVLEHFKMPRVEDVLHLFTGRTQKRKPDIAPLARILLDVAAAGDATARKLVEVHGAELGDYALAAARKVGVLWTPFYLVLTGSALSHSSKLLNVAVIERVRGIQPDVRPVDTRFEPAVGAVMLALEMAGVRIDERVTERLTISVPHRALFAR